MAVTPRDIERIRERYALDLITITSRLHAHAIMCNEQRHPTSTDIHLVRDLVTQFEGIVARKYLPRRNLQKYHKVMREAFTEVTGHARKHVQRVNRLRAGVMTKTWRAAKRYIETQPEKVTLMDSMWNQLKGVELRYAIDHLLKGNVRGYRERMAAEERRFDAMVVINQ